MFIMNSVSSIDNIPVPIRQMVGKAGQSFVIKKIKRTSSEWLVLLFIFISSHSIMAADLPAKAVPKIQLVTTLAATAAGASVSSPLPTTTTTTVALAQNQVKASPPVSVKPEPEAAITLPKLLRRNESVFIVYRNTEKGAIEAGGFDTQVFGFSSCQAGSQAGSLEEAVVSERRLEGVTPSHSFSFARSGEETSIMLISGGMSADYAVLRTTQSGIEVQTDGWRRVYARTPKGALTIRTELTGQTMVEEWKSTGKDAFKTSEASTVVGSGGYSLPDKGKVIFSQRSGADTSGTVNSTTSIWVDKDEVRYRTEGSGPLCEVMATGLGLTLSGDFALENLALIDTVVGHDRNMIPALFWMSLRYKSAK